MISVLARSAARRLPDRHALLTSRQRWRALSLGVRCLLAMVPLGLASCSARVKPPEELPLPYRQAEDAFRLADYDRAVRGYQVFLRSGEGEELVPRAFYKWALAEFRRKRYEECVRVLDEMEQRFPKQQWTQVYELRGDAEEARGRVISALRWWELAWAAASGDQQQTLHRRIADALSRLNEVGLRNAQAVLGTAEFQSLIDARLREEAAARAPASSTRLPGTAPTPAPVVRRERSPTTATLPRIGCLLPLTGPYATYGQRSLNGIRLAFGPDAGRLVVRDTRGEPAVAQTALEELIAEPHIVAAIGPLRSSVAEAVAPRARQAGLPLAVLAQREGADGHSIIHAAMTYERQAAALAEYAATALRLSRVGVLYPRDAYGTSLSEAFRDQFERRGGRVVGTLAYGPGARDFGVETLSVRQWTEKDGLQAVFIPDYASTAAFLARELRRVNRNLTLLGSNGWNDIERLAPAARDLDGAVFVDGFFAASTRPATRAFVAAYQQAYQTVPQILEAQAYDAAMLVRAAIEAGARSRGEVVPTLEALRTVEGATGAIGIGPKGIQRELFVLQLRSGAIMEVLPGTARRETQAAVPPGKCGGLVAASGVC